MVMMLVGGVVVVVEVVEVLRMRGLVKVWAVAWGEGVVVVVVVVVVEVLMGVMLVMVPSR